MSHRHEFLSAHATAALLESCENGIADSRFIAELLQMGACIDARCPEGNTPLMLAARSGHAEKVRYLIACGADAAAACPSGRTAHMIAAERGNAEAARVLMRHFNRGARQYAVPAAPPAPSRRR